MQPDEIEFGNNFSDAGPVHSSETPLG